MNLQEQLENERQLIEDSKRSLRRQVAYEHLAAEALPQRNAQLQAVLALVREQRAQGYNAVSLDRLTRTIEEATP